MGISAKASSFLLLLVAALSNVSATPVNLAPSPTTTTPTTTTFLPSIRYPYQRRQGPIITVNDTTTTPHIENSYGWCLDVTIDGSTATPAPTVRTIANGALLSINQTCDATSVFQNWTLVPWNGTEEFAIQIQGSDNITYCVDIPVTQLNNNGAWLQMWQCAYTSNQLWRKNPLNSNDAKGDPGFQLVSVGSGRCFDQSLNGKVEHVAQWGCYPNAPSDITGQTWHELNCPSSGCGVTGISPTFTPYVSPTSSSSTTSTTSSNSTTTSATPTAGGGDNVTVNSGIVGGTIGGVLVVGIAAGVGLFFFFKRYQRRKAEEVNNPTYINNNLREANTALMADAGTGAGPYSPTSKKEELAIYQPGTDNNKESNFEHRNSIRATRKLQTPPAYGDSQMANDSYVLTPIHFNKPEEPDHSVKDDEPRSETTEVTSPSEVTESTHPKSSVPSPW